MSRFHTSLELERLNTEALASRLEAIGFSIDRFPDIVDYIPVKSLELSPELALIT
jgi:predicted solute-binding protein